MQDAGCLCCQQCCQHPCPLSQIARRPCSHLVAGCTSTRAGCGSTGLRARRHARRRALPRDSHATRDGHAGGQGGEAQAMLEAREEKRRPLAGCVRSHRGQRAGDPPSPAPSCRSGPPPKHAARPPLSTPQVWLQPAGQLAAASVRLAGWPGACSARSQGPQKAIGRLAAPSTPTRAQGRAGCAARCLRHSCKRRSALGASVAASEHIGGRAGAVTAVRCA